MFPRMGTVSQPRRDQRALLRIRTELFRRAISVTSAAAKLAVCRTYLSLVLHGKRRGSKELHRRINALLITTSKSSEAHATKETPVSHRGSTHTRVGRRSRP